MKNLFSLIAAIIFPFIAMAQTNVDRVAGVLDSLTTFQMNDLKMSPNLKFGDVNGDQHKKDSTIHNGKR